MNELKNQGLFGLDDTDDDVFDQAFGNAPIGDLGDTAAAVGDITADTGVPQEAPGLDLERASLAAAIVRETVRRVRLLTVAVVAIVLYLVLKEAK